MPTCPVPAAAAEVGAHCGRHLLPPIFLITRSRRSSERNVQRSVSTTSMPRMTRITSTTKPTRPLKASPSGHPGVSAASLRRGSHPRSARTARRSPASPCAAAPANLGTRRLASPIDHEHRRREVVDRAQELAAGGRRFEPRCRYRRNALSPCRPGPGVAPRRARPRATRSRTPRPAKQSHWSARTS